MIVDSHCHLDMLEKEHNLDEIVKNAKANNVEYMQTICVKLSDFDNILSIAKKYDNVYASVGVHPNEVDSENVVNSDTLLRLSDHPKVIGLGETGLDYYRNLDKLQQEAQIFSFNEHIKTSQASQLPVIIHTRQANKDTLSVIETNMKKQQFPALIHCFTESKDFASKVLDLGLYISISGIATFKNADDLREIVKYVPSNRLLVETDSPYLAPVPYRGKTNQPAYTRYVLECVAELKNTTTEKMAQITTDNFYMLFNLRF
ncbi:MAG TPA: TatD family hydrolase [Candidatus Megaira endosymbiont of Nemacystus decipiens]|nr:TatD family hydrolase [Candidatus Megaera endosymbiont of Nemacystus decipiens]